MELVVAANTDLRHGIYVLAVTRGGVKLDLKDDTAMSGRPPSRATRRISPSTGSARWSSRSSNEMGGTAMTDYSQFAKLSLFEIKDELIKLASGKADKGRTWRR